MIGMARDFIFLVVVEKERRAQNWDSGPNDTPFFDHVTETHICYTKEQVDRVYAENKYCEKISKYDCFKRD
jgi:hypothetical protein